ncbi:unnamed protein product [Laminaria digitata]
MMMTMMIMMIHISALFPKIPAVVYRLNSPSTTCTIELQMYEYQAGMIHTGMLSASAYDSVTCVQQQHQQRHNSSVLACKTNAAEGSFFVYTYLVQWVPRVKSAP